MTDWKARAEAAEAREREKAEVLEHLVDIHHRTITGSRKHDAEKRDWIDCDCRSCRAVVLVIGPERSRVLRKQFAEERANPSEEGGEG